MGRKVQLQWIEGAGRCQDEGVFYALYY